MMNFTGLFTGTCSVPASREPSGYSNAQFHCLAVIWTSMASPGATEYSIQPFSPQKKIPTHSSSGSTLQTISSVVLCVTCGVTRPGL